MVLVAMPACAQAAGPSNASLQDASPKQVLLDAKLDVEARAKAAKDQRFSFVMQLQDRAQNVAYQVSYDPAQTRAQAFRVEKPADPNSDSYKAAQDQIRTTRKQAQDKTPDQALVIQDLPDFHADHYTFLKRENGYLIYGFDPSGTQILHGAKQKLVAKYLKGQLGIVADTGQMAWMRMYSSRPFKPLPFAKVDHFNLLLTFKPAWVNGPLVLKSEAVKAKGSAMFKTMKRDKTIQYDDFKPAGPHHS